MTTLPDGMFSIGEHDNICLLREIKARMTDTITFGICLGFSSELHCFVGT
jgi:hypothetical protein